LTFLTVIDVALQGAKQDSEQHYTNTTPATPAAASQYDTDDLPF
jgi:hypothetical protein